MRLNSYILSEGRGRSVGSDEALEFISKSCKKSLEQAKRYHNVLYRGVSGASGYYMIDPKSGTRMSANTTNQYTLIMDNDPRWSAYPKRSKSLVCTTDEYKTHSYGSVYAVFAKDGSRYGVCPTSDLWQSFNKSFAHLNMGSVNSYLLSLEEEMASSTIADANTYNELMIGVNRLGDWIDNVIKIYTDENYGVLSNLMDNSLFRMWYKNKHVPFSKWFIESFDPKKNDFYVTTNLHTVFTSGRKHKEVWTDGESVMILAMYLSDGVLDEIR